MEKGDLLRNKETGDIYIFVGKKEIVGPTYTKSAFVVMKNNSISTIENITLFYENFELIDEEE